MKQQTNQTKNYIVKIMGVLQKFETGSMQKKNETRMLHCVRRQGYAINKHQKS